MSAAALKELPLLSAEAAGAVSRWQLPVFEVPSRLQNDLPTAAQLEAVEAAAYQDGVQRGHAEGYAAGQRAAQQETERLRALIEHLQRPLAHLGEDTERALLDTACAIARRLTLNELNQNPEAIERIVREALSLLPSYVRDVRLHLHADDATFLRERLTPPPDAQSFRIVVDASLARGDCRVLTESTQLDARLETRLAVLHDALSATAVPAGGAS
ncbi:MAG TPA: FliH/SctL family protein [Solimonas sp.]